MTKGFSRPFAPNGSASLIPPLPWKFSGDLTLIHFRTDPAAIAKYLPSPLEPANDGGEALLWSPRLICHSASEDPAVMNPGRTSYNVCVLALPAKLGGVDTLFSAFQWGDRDWLVVLSWFLGACSKLAHIEESGTHPLLQRQNSTATGGLGTTVNRLVSRNGETVVRMSFKEEEEISLDALEFYFKRLPLTCMRHIPDCHVPPIGHPLVHDLTQMVMSNVSFGVPTKGSGSLVFGAADNEELLPLQPHAVLDSYRIPMSFSLEGVRVIHDYLVR